MVAKPPRRHPRWERRVAAPQEGPYRRGMQLAECKRARVINDYFVLQHSVQQIASDVPCDTRTVWKYINSYLQHGHVARKRTGGAANAKHKLRLPERLFLRVCGTALT